MFGRKKPDRPRPKSAKRDSGLSQVSKDQK